MKNKKSPHKYTQQQLRFLKDNRKLSNADLTQQFNEKFGAALSRTAVSATLKRNKWRTGRTGRFAPGLTPWNAGKKGLPSKGRSVETQFKKGQTPLNSKPLGHERICSKDGFILIKVAEPNPYTGHSTRYRFKHHVVWEQHNEPVKKGEVLRFVDGNKRNCDINNLFVVSKAVHLRLNQNGYHELPDELKPAMHQLTLLQVDIFSKSKRLQGAKANA